MKQLYIEDDTGKRVPLKEVRGISGSGMLVVMVVNTMKRDETIRLEAELTERFGTKTVVLDARFNKVLRLEQ